MLVEMESFWVIARAVIITIYPTEPSLVELFIEKSLKINSIVIGFIINEMTSKEYTRMK
jgi:hypothetical protein